MRENTSHAIYERLTGRDGIEIEAQGSLLWTIRPGRVGWVCLYRRETSPRTAGLAE